MRFEAATVQELAGLSRLEVAPERATALAGELSRIVSYVEMLAALEGIDEGRPGATPRRDDVARPGSPRLVELAAGCDADVVRLPRVVETE
ncbi:MAG: aspartyl/glutamyl-tRNA amidotransferase subunit C [Deltaproteobacteria bacterium]|nr:aspartyl/glutamyl-tRNA amidotransferase subunit C [Deltaproteobacteria bacterium]